MFFRKVNKSQPGNPLNIPDLFASMQAFEEQMNFAAITGIYGTNVPTICAGSDVTSGKTRVLLEETPGTYPVYSIIAPNEYCYMSPHLTSCAAVIFYCDDCVYAYHASGGFIDQSIVEPIIQSNDFEYVIYATPTITLTPGNDYQKSVDYLTSHPKIGANKVGMIDGFIQNVFADGMGNIQFI